MMKIIETIKQRQHRPALIIAGLMLLHVWVFSWPDIAYMLECLWNGLYFLFAEGSSQIIWPLLELPLVLADLAIWFLSVFITWAAFRKSRKKAYIFILAYLLLPLAVQPTARVIKHFVVAHRLEELERQQTTREVCVSEPKPATPQPFVVECKLNIPVAPLLLLAGVWFLYKKEERKDDEQSN